MLTVMKVQMSNSNTSPGTGKVDPKNEIVIGRIVDLNAERTQEIVREAFREYITGPIPLNNPALPLLPSTRDIKPILLGDSHRQQLEALFGGAMLNTAEDVVRYAHRLAAVAIATKEDGSAAWVTIPLDTLERLDSRRPVDTTLQEMVTTEVLDFLERFINGER